MLSQLFIQNVAVIEKVTVELGRGFNAFTGETGAGKSILIDSINAVLGGRTSKDLVRTGADRAMVTAVFSELSEGCAKAAEELGYGPDENGELLVSREISSDGHSVCKVNMRPATVSVLKGLSAALIDVHGQQDNRMLTDPELHIGYIDSYAGDSALLSSYRESYDSLRETEREIKKLTMDDSQKSARIDLLKFQIGEIEEAEIEPGEEESLETQRKRINGSEHLVELCTEAIAALDGGEENEGALAQFGTIIDDCSKLAEYFPEFSALPEKFRGMYYEIEEFGNDLRAASGELDFDPALQDKIERRLDQIFRLKRKYGGSVEAMLGHLESAKKELESIEFSAEKLETLSKQRKELLGETDKRAKALTKARLEAAKRFSDSVCMELAFLDMPNVQFVVKCENVELAESGADRVEFYISTNPGEPPKPLAKIASGGELSRIMLSIKNVMADRDDIDTLIFDEVDTGVSGSAAQKIGKKLKQVSKGRQIICVTHLAQVAAYADNHLLIKKNVQDGRTYTEVTALDRNGRVKELARIMGGSEQTEALLKSADELLRLSGN